MSGCGDLGVPSLEGLPLKLPSRGRLRPLQPLQTGQRTGAPGERFSLWKMLTALFLGAGIIIWGKQ